MYSFMRKVGPNKWCVYAHKKSANGKRQRFGCYTSEAAAKKRLQQMHQHSGGVLHQGAIYTST